MQDGDLSVRGSAGYRILSVLVRNPAGLTRQELAAASGVPSASLAAILRDPRSQGLGRVVVESKARRASPGGGPRPGIVRLRPELCVAGVEIGHGHVRVGIAGLDGELWPDAAGRRYEQIVMPVYKERRKTLNWIAGGPDGEPGVLSRRLAQLHGERATSSEMQKPLVLGVGVSVAGPVDPQDGRLVCARPAEGFVLQEEEGSIACADWDGESAGKSLMDRLRGGDRVERLGWSVCRFRSAGASELCAKAEMRDGLLRGADLALYIKWTGNLTAAVVLDGEVLAGARGLAGGFPMHSPKPPSGEAGGHSPQRLPLGIAIGVRRLVHELADELGLRRKRSDELLRDYVQREVLSISRGEDAGLDSSAKARVKARLSEAATLLGRTLAPTVDMLDASRVIVGGGIFGCQDWSTIAEPLSEGIRATVMAPSKAPEVDFAQHASHPALDGAIASRLESEELIPALLEVCAAMPPVSGAVAATASGP